jgi:hypothetical protein
MRLIQKAGGLIMYAAYILHSIAAYVERVGGFLYCQTLLLLENLQM